MESRKIIQMSLLAKPKYRHRLQNKVMVTMGRSRGWDELGDWDWHIYLHVCSVTQSCLTLATYHMDCSLPGFSVHGIIQARILEWVAISFSRGSSQPRGRTYISFSSCIGRQIVYHWTIWLIYTIYLNI